MASPRFARVLLGCFANRWHSPLPRRGCPVLGRNAQVLRREIQMVFQDPQGSLNPRKRVGQIVATGLRLRGVPRNERESRVRLLLIGGRSRTRSTSIGSHMSSPEDNGKGSEWPEHWPCNRA